MCEIIIEPAKDNNNLGAIVKLLDDESLTRAVGLFLPLQRENRVQAIKTFVHQNHVMVVKLNGTLMKMVSLYFKLVVGSTVLMKYLSLR